jgi:hypothetical protein
MIQPFNYNKIREVTLYFPIRALWVETFHRNQWKLCSGIIIIIDPHGGFLFSKVVTGADAGLYISHLSSTGAG